MRGEKPLAHEYCRRNESTIYVNAHYHNDSDMDIITIILCSSQILSWLVWYFDCRANKKSVPHWRNELYCLHVLWQLQCRYTCAYYVTIFSSRKWDTLHRRHFKIDESKTTTNVHIFAIFQRTSHSAFEYITHQKVYWNIQIHRVICSVLKCWEKVLRQNEIWNDTCTVPTHPWKVKHKMRRKKYSFLCSFLRELARASCREWTGRGSNARIVRSAYLINRQNGRKKKNRHSEVQPRVSTCTVVVQLDESQTESLNQFYSSTVNEQPLSSSSSPFPIQK